MHMLDPLLDLSETSGFSVGADCVVDGIFVVIRVGETVNSSVRFSDVAFEMNER